MILAAALAAACGGSSSTTGGSPITDPVTDPLRPGSGTTDVTTLGTDYPITPVEALSYVQSEVCPASMPYLAPFGLTYLILELGNAPGRCERLAAGQEKADRGVVMIEISRTRVDGTVPGFRLGTYQLPSSGGALPDGTSEKAYVRLFSYDSWCDEFHDDVNSGTVTIDSADATGITGSVSVDMQYGGTITGTFATKPCAVDMFYQCTGFAEYPVITSCVP